MKPGNLLVTGGAGFIGSNFVHYILKKDVGCRVIVLDTLTYAGNVENIQDLGVELVRCDIRDHRCVFKALEKHDITHVLHLAAESHVDRSINSPRTFIDTNINGTFTLLEACQAHWEGSNRPHRFHHVSTDEVYGSLSLDPSEKPFTETTPYAPNSPYAASKAASDMLVRSYNKTYGMDTVITHCSNNFGPRQHSEKLIPTVIQNALARKPIPIYGDGLNVRDWIFVDDHCEALWQVLTRGKSGETYNIGGDNEWSNLNLVPIICELVEAMVPNHRCKDMIHFVSDRPGHDRRYSVDSRKIREELGWNPSTPMADGIYKTVKWYINRYSK